MKAFAPSRPCLKPGERPTYRCLKKFYCIRIEMKAALFFSERLRRSIINFSLVGGEISPLFLILDDVVAYEVRLKIILRNRA